MSSEVTATETNRRPTWLVAIFYFTGVAVLVALLMFFNPSDGETDLLPGASEETTTTTVPEVNVSIPSFVPGEEPVADAAEVILPSVVHIRTSSGLGSGVIYDAEGLIVTAAHVVDGSETVRVRFADGEQVQGTVLGTVPDVDIAVIQVDRDGLTPATFVTEKPRVGQLAIAVGSPWGLESTVTAGIISAIDQTNCGQGTCASMVQTDAAINPGNSGGALVDRSGHVVGINVSIFSSSGANDGVGFAVPADIAMEYADSIVSGDPIDTAFLGVRGEDVNADGQAGARIITVVPESAAADAGLSVGDVVIAVDGVPIFGWGDLIAQIRSNRPGDEVEVDVLRDGEITTIAITLGVNPDNTG